MGRDVVKVPVVLQMEELDGGAACLGMVMGYHNKWVGLDQLRGACELSRDGIQPESIRRAAEGYGLDCTIERLGVDELGLRVLPVGGAGQRRDAAVAAVERGIAVVFPAPAILFASEIRHVERYAAAEDAPVRKDRHRRHPRRKIYVELRPLAFAHAAQEFPHGG